MQEALAALAEPRRREILRLVWRDELPAGEIAAHFDVTRPAVSKHLRVLKRAGLVLERRAGTQRIYRADPAAMAELRAMLETFWEDGLRGVKAAAENHSRRGRRDR